MRVANTGQQRPSLRCERELVRQGYALVAGVDEVGRGSWAGPVVAAAVILPAFRRGLLPALAGVRDSKQLTSVQRLRVYEELRAWSTAVSVGWATHHVIDTVGIAAANRLAMCRAIARLSPAPQAVLLDYFALPECELPQTCVTKGDVQCMSIAAASIVAKVFRDRWMDKLDRRYPGYGFGRHRGYGTTEHRAALLSLGPSPMHRRSYAPISFLTQ